MVFKGVVPVAMAGLVAAQSETTIFQVDPRHPENNIGVVDGAGNATDRFSFSGEPVMSGLRVSFPTSGAVHHFLRTLLCNLYHPEKSFAQCPYNVNDMQFMLRNYGCNCYPSASDYDQNEVCNSWNCNTWSQGANGRPIDEIDAACTRQRECLKCLELDRDAGLIQDPTDTPLFASDYCGRWLEFTYHISGREIKCGLSSNPDYVNGFAADEECDFRACQIARQFAEDVHIHIDTADIPTFISERQAVGMYDINQDPSLCANTNFGQYQRDTCCGTYPSRLPFNSVARQCCDSGLTLPIGEC